MRLTGWLRPQKGGTAGTPQPLVAIPGVPGDTKARDIKIQHTRRMSAIYQNRNTAVGKQLRNFGDRQDRSGLGRDVVQYQETGPGRDRIFERFDNLRSAPDRIVEMFNHEPRLGPIAHELQRTHNGAIRQVGGNHLIAWEENEGTQHRVDRGRRVVQEYDIVTERADITPQRICRLPQGGMQFFFKESRGLSLDFLPPVLSRRHDRARGRAKSAMIQIGNVFL